MSEKFWLTVVILTAMTIVSTVTGDTSIWVGGFLLAMWWM